MYLQKVQMLHLIVILVKIGPYHFRYLQVAWFPLSQECELFTESPILVNSVFYLQLIAVTSTSIK